MNRRKDVGNIKDIFVQYLRLDSNSRVFFAVSRTGEEIGEDGAQGTVFSLSLQFRFNWPDFVNRIHLLNRVEQVYYSIYFFLGAIWASISSAMCLCPFDKATRRAVRPSLSLIDMSAPWFSSERTPALFPLAAATCSAV